MTNDFRRVLKNIMNITNEQLDKIKEILSGYDIYQEYFHHVATIDCDFKVFANKEVECLYYLFVDIFDKFPKERFGKFELKGKFINIDHIDSYKKEMSGKRILLVADFITDIDEIRKDIQALKKDSDLRKRLFDENLTRENLEIITRKYCGLIPYRVFNDPYGKKDFQMPKDKAPLLAKAIMGSAYVENRQTSINMNNARSSNSNGNRGSFWSRLFGTKTEAESNTSLGQYTSTTTYTKNEGVLFYKSGAVIFNKKLYSKFNYATKDSETGVRTQVDSILIGEVNEERLKRDEEYRKAFVTEIFSPSRLKNARTVSGFPYIGNFTESKRFEYDMDAIKDFNELVQYGNT